VFEPTISESQEHSPYRELKFLKKITLELIITVDFFFFMKKKGQNPYFEFIITEVIGTLSKKKQK
jgi:hypothetical protein